MPSTSPATSVDSSTPTEGTREVDVDRRPWRTIAQFTGSGALLAPLIVLLVQQFTQLGWGASSSAPERWAIPCCDYAALELGTRAYVSGEQWMGLYSRQGWRHPGPAPFLWDAMFRILPGHAFAEHQVAAVALAIVAVGALVLFAWRHTSTVAALVGLCVVAAWMLRFDIGMLREPWNPISSMLWVGIFVVCAATFASTPRSRRSGWAIVGAAISGSMAVQAHLGAAPIVVIGVIMIAVGAWRARDARPVQRGALYACLALLVLWALPLLDLAFGDHGLWRIVTVDDDPSNTGFSWGDAMRTMVQAIGLGPARQGVALGPASPFLPTASLTIGQVVAAIAGVALGIRVLMTRQRHRRLAFATALALVGLVVTTAMVGLAGSQYYPYLLLPVVMCGPIVWMCGAIALTTDLLRHLRAVWRSIVSGVVAVALIAFAIVGIGSLPSDTLLDRYLSPDLASLERSVLDRCESVPTHPIVWVQPGVDWTIALPLIATIDRCATVKVRTWESFLAGEPYRAPSDVERDNMWILPVDALNVGARVIASDGRLMVLVDPTVESVGHLTGGSAS